MASFSEIVAMLAVFAFSAVISCNPQTGRPSLTALQLTEWQSTKTRLKGVADGGDVNAKYELGLMYEFPQDGNSPDRAGAAYWYKQAADRDNARGMYRLGIYYYDQGNDDSAYKYFGQAATKGMPAAMFRYGDMIVKTNLRGNGQYYGLPWIQKAADVGDPDAANELGRRAWQLYLTPGSAASKYAAAQWFSKAAAAGSCEGALNLGGVYFNGVGVEQNATKADAAFRAAESCVGAPSWVDKKAASFRGLIASHKLPDPSLSKPAPMLAPDRLDSHEDQMTMLVAGIVAVVGVAAMLSSNSPASTHNTGNDYMDDFYDRMAKQQSDFALGRSYCAAGWSYAAGTMGVWC